MLEPVSATSGFDSASLAILARLQELSGDVQSLASRLHHPPYRSPGATSGSAGHPLALDLARHLQRGNLNQVLSWDVWQPHTTPPHLEAGREGLTPESSSRSDLETAGPDRGLDLTLFTGYLDAFFRNVHILNPVLDEQQVRGRLTKFLLGGVGWDADSCLLLLVLANGACSSVFSDSATSNSPIWRNEQRWANAQALFDAAEKRKGILWRADYLTQARCHFYSGIFMMVLMQPFDAWRYFLQGLATCQRLTDPSHRREARDHAHIEKQAEESIYWSCWKSERELRFELDMPDFAPVGYDHPVMFPTLPEVTDQDELRMWYFYLAEISLWRSEMIARKSMAESVNHEPDDSDSLAQRVEDLDMSLVSWHASLPDAIRLDATSEVDTRDVLQFVLRGRLTYNYEILTWPFLETLLLFGQHQSTRATELAARGVRVHYDRLSINRPGMYHLHHGTWLMCRSSARSACVLLAVARSTSADLLPADWLQLVSNTVDMLEYWSETSENAIFLFLKSILRDFVQ